MNFNEENFRQLVDETQKKIIALGTTSELLLKRQHRFAEQVICHLKASDIPFERESCLQWVESIDYNTVGGIRLTLAGSPKDDL